MIINKMSPITNDKIERKYEEEMKDSKRHPYAHSG